MESTTHPTASGTTNVFLVEDSAPIRDRLVELLSKIEDVRIVGAADSPRTAIEGIFATQPHCVVLDIQLVGGSGIEVLRAVAPRKPSIDFIVLTNHASPQYRRAYMDAGARWFFDKSGEINRIRDVLSVSRHEH